MLAHLEGEKAKAVEEESELALAEGHLKLEERAIQKKVDVSALHCVFACSGDNPCGSY